MTESNNIVNLPSNKTTTVVETDKLIAKTDEAIIHSKKTKIIKPKEPPKRTDVKNPLTNEQIKELDSMVNEWTATSNLSKKPMHFGQGWNKIFYKCLDGEVNGKKQIEQTEYEKVKSFIQQKIMILENAGSKRIMRRKEGYRNKRIGSIQARCKELSIQPEKRKAYQLYRYGKDSLVDFSDDELDDFYGYVIRGTPKFTIPQPNAQETQQDRENALRVLLGVFEEKAKANGQQFNSQRLNNSKTEMLNLLAEREPDLFKGLSEEGFNKFWSKQKICKLKPGQRIKG